MKTICSLVLACAAVVVLATAQAASAEDPYDLLSSGGRYSIATTPGGIYFLDTKTGALWFKSHPATTWTRIKSPADEAAEQKPKKPAPEPVTLKLPEGGATMPMEQRERRKIPGSEGSLFVHLGDITGGQVFVEVIDVNDQCLVERTSLKVDEFVEFKVAKKTVYLQITEMVNNLIGEDICKVRITYKKPERKAENAEENPKKAAGS